MTNQSNKENYLTAIQDLLQETENEFRNRLRDAAYDDLTAFAEYINPDEPPAKHHIIICDKLMLAESGEINRIMLSAPPGSGKSSYSSRLYPAWYLGRNSRKKFIQAGHTQNFVESEFGRKTRDIIMTPEFLDVFPDVKVSTDSRSAGRWNLNNPRGGYIAKGVGQAIAGFRGNMAVVDDPIGSRIDAESATIRQQIFDWYTADLIPRMLPNSALFIIATRWHTDDLCGRVEELSKQGKGHHFEVINISAECDNSATDILNREEGEFYWDFYSKNEFLVLKSTLPSRDWCSLYQGTPMDAVGGLVQSGWVKYYSGDVRKEQTIRRIVGSLDSAAKTKERNDYSVCLIWAEDTLGRHYLLDVLRKKMEFPQMSKEVIELCQKWGVTALLVEDKGSGTQFIQINQGKPGVPPIISFTPDQSKEFRFDAVSPMFEAGLVFIPERSIFSADYEKEILTFPTGKHDDQVDATSQYLKWAGTRRTKGGTSKIKTTAGSNRKEAVRQVEEALQRLLEKRRNKGP